MDSMIKIIPNNDLKITKIKYDNNGFEKTIDVKVGTVKSATNEKNVGTILEKYLSLVTVAENYFEDNKLILEQFIHSYPIPFPDFSPDFIMCFYPADKNRKQLLKSFRDKIISNYTNSDIIDYSDKFVKKDPSKSIKKHSLTKDDFEFAIDIQTPIKNLLIIDDVIDEGSTVKIFLDKLVEANLLNNETVIKMACIYNRPKQEKKNYMQAFKDNLDKDNNKPSR